MQIYQVRAGDTLFGIAQAHYGPGQTWRWREIASANRIPPPFRLFTGQILRLPYVAGAKPTADGRRLPCLGGGPMPPAGGTVGRCFSALLVESPPESTTHRQHASPRRNVLLFPQTPKNFSRVLPQLMQPAATALAHRGMRSSEPMLSVSGAMAAGAKLLTPQEFQAQNQQWANEHPSIKERLGKLTVDMTFEGHEQFWKWAEKYIDPSDKATRTFLKGYGIVRKGAGFLATNARDISNAFSDAWNGETLQPIAEVGVSALVDFSPVGKFSSIYGASVGLLAGIYYEGGNLINRGEFSFKSIGTFTIAGFDYFEDAKSYGIQQSVSAAWQSTVGSPDEKAQSVLKSKPKPSADRSFERATELLK